MYRCEADLLSSVELMRAEQRRQQIAAEIAQQNGADLIEATNQSEQSVAGLATAG
ncbi:MAG TPA: hypothetical protein VGE30_02295 [Candidatus Saccharimonadales bacterium]